MDRQQIKARFFGAHIWCKISAANAFGQGEYILSGVSTLNEEALMVFTEDGGSFSTDITHCELVLRPLSSISDAEAIDALTMATGLYIVEIERDDNKIVGVGMSRGSGNIISGGGNVAMWIKISPLPIGRFLETWNSQGGEPPECMDYIAIDYLRSINVCVPFMGLDPVKEGWAILEEKIPANAPQTKKEEEI